MAAKKVSLILVLSISTLVAACGSDDAGVETSESADATVESEPTPGSDTTATAGTEPAGSTTIEPTEESTDAWPTPSIEWTECGDNIECGSVEVPIDYSDPDSDTIELALARHLALDSDARIGSLLVNPGGPGFGGTVLALSAANIYSSRILDRFDVVGFDPRGTGSSTPAIDCIDDYDLFSAGDITPDTDAEKQELVDAARDFTELCFEKNGDLLPQVGTNNVARDMDMIRRALGEEKISYFGFSYGSELGATWATLFPSTVRAAVLDGAADPTADSDEGSRQQIAGFEQSIATFLAQCSNDDGCAIHNDGDAEGAFDTLMADLDENPIPTEAGRPDLTRGMALTAVAQAMYDDGYWPTLEVALADAIDGDGSGLLELWDAYYQRMPDGTYGNELEAFVNILCADDPERKTIEEADAVADTLRAAGPRFSPGTTGNYGCTFWPAAIDPRVVITGKSAGPILVIGTTGDAATPLESTRNMVKALEDGRLIVADAEQHTGYNTSLCVNDAVDSYLIDLEAPDSQLDC